MSPAFADDPPADICGHRVGGEILKKYQQMGGETSPLGCPTSDELSTPDGRGKYNTFTGGSIYWTASTGAHPVWGVIRDKWGSLGWEAGALGYPVSDELTNQDGQGRRQQFEGGTMYWHPTLSHGAHPVWGKIGHLWGQYGWESGAFGYPTTDEQPDSDIKGKVQYFSTNGTALFWSAGQGKGHEVCTGECVGYQAASTSDWVKRTQVSFNAANGDIETSVYPTDLGFTAAGLNFKKLWNETWQNVPYPNGLTDSQKSSMYKQLACHATYDLPVPGGNLGGPSWDVESWRPDVSWVRAMSPLGICNWN
ncbi:DUF2599 domain-containing protein [Streptomyces sp. NPDC046821]|uniref:DUF2599 domain-containing protein n=1 Tax=Streptomyces sp. NPDC046821 TaxID=3154702 RepID=UPI0033F6531D